MDEYEKVLKSFTFNDLINRNKLFYLVSLKLKHKIEFVHIINIIQILIEEIISDLFHKGKFMLDNFGALTFKRRPPRKFYNFQTRQVQKSRGNNAIQFHLFNKFRVIVLRNLDIARTFGDGYVL